MKNDKIKEEFPKSQSTHESKNKTNKSAAKVEKQIIEELQLNLAETEAKLAESLDKYLRLSAEFDNYRKRTLKEKVDLLKAAGEECLVRIIPVLDDLERALPSINEAKELNPVKEGVVLIYNKFKDTLAQLGIKEIEARNQEFNTDLHEAITKIETQDENMKGKVIDIVQKGYYLNDKVIRFAKVIVGE